MSGLIMKNTEAARAPRTRRFVVESFVEGCRRANQEAAADKQAAIREVKILWHNPYDNDNGSRVYDTMWPIAEAAYHGRGGKDAADCDKSFDSFKQHWAPTCYGEPTNLCGRHRGISWDRERSGSDRSSRLP